MKPTIRNLLPLVIANNGAGALMPIVLPLLIADVTRGTNALSSAEAAALAGFISMGLALGVIASTLFLQQANWRLLLIFSNLLGFASSLALCFIEPVWLAAPTCAALGIAGGIMITIASATIARFSKDPDRTSSKVMAGYSGLTLLYSVCAAFLVEYVGYKGVFAMTSLLMLGCLFPVRCMPSLRGRDMPPISAFGTSVPSVSLTPAVLLLLGAGAVYATEGAYWNYCKKIALSAGAGTAATDGSLAFSQLFGVVGAFVSAWCSRTLGRAPSLLTSVCLLGAIVVAATFVFHPAIALSAILMYAFLLSFSLSMLMGTAALLDPSGKVIALLGAATSIGTTLGAWGSGILLASENRGYHPLGIFSAITAGAAALFLVFPSLFAKTSSLKAV
jgi:predicted MFS family arabinose efflux permease